MGLDGVAYRDMKALQAGVTYTNIWGRRLRRQAFSLQEGYFPVSRMVSTFPSTSDVAWTDIFGDRPLPGYQRTYFSAAANSQIVINGITTTMEHESQMDWELENNMFRTMGYVYPVHTFELEIARNDQKLLERHRTTMAAITSIFAPRTMPSTSTATSSPCFAGLMNSFRRCAPATGRRRDATCKS